MRRVTDSRADEVARNRALWAVVNERYTDAAADELWARPDAVWGLFAVPERELGVLGDVRGLDVLELASGTAYVSAWLARAGANPVAVDLSGEQLATARRLQRRLGPTFPLVQCDVERRAARRPVRRPRRQRARCRGVVRPRALAARGGPRCCDPVGAWSSSPTATCPPCACRPTRGSRGSGCCAGTRRPTACSGRAVVSSTTRRTATGCDCCARSGFVVEALHEIFAPADRTDHPFYEIVSPQWASRWPAEELWVARRA